MGVLDVAGRQPSYIYSLITLWSVCYLWSGALKDTNIPVQLNTYLYPKVSGQTRSQLAIISTTTGLVSPSE